MAFKLSKVLIILQSYKHFTQFKQAYSISITLYKKYTMPNLFQQILIIFVLFIFLSLIQARNKHNGVTVAAKIIEIKEHDDLNDFRVEIDILTECKHPNIVGLEETFLHQSKLWVSYWF